MKLLLFVFALVLMTTLTLKAQQTDSSPLEQRAKQTVETINNPQNLEQYFSAAFLAKISPEQFKAVSSQLVSNYGRAVTISKFTKINETTAELLISFDKNFVGKAVLVIEDKSPYLVTGLQILSFEPNSGSFDDIIGEMKKLPGQAALTITKLNGDKYESLAAFNADKPLAIGSTFKLYILAELVRQINAGQKKWSDTVALNESSLPSGMMQEWAQGTPVTLATLASMMISISDNTATDQLLIKVGRENVEKMLATAGNSNPNLSIPFLKTIEMFKIKGGGAKDFGRKYLAADLAGKRALLTGEISSFSKTDVNLQEFLAKPVYVSQIEWFASPADLARLMNYLRLNTEKAPADLGRGVLTINKALPAADAKDWNYIGYKGGSETGVISLTYLLQSAKGEWYVVSGSWNDEQKAVDNEKFVGMMQKAVKLLAIKTK
jgi:hypothetical protein